MAASSELISPHSWLTKEHLAKIIDTVGTPTFVYNEDRLRENGERFWRAAKDSGIRNRIRSFVPFFPNSNPHIFRPLQDIGMGAMIQVPAEHTVLRRFGVDSFIASTGHLSDAEIDTWIEIGCPIFLSSIPEVEYVIEHHPDEPIRVRFDSLSSSKPGVKYGQLEEFRRLLDQHGRKLDGFELYCGSSISAEEMRGFIEQVFLVYARHFSEVKAIDFAGGYGFDYACLDQSSTHFDWDAYFHSLRSAVERYGVPDDVEFWFEPARDFLADVGILVLSVERLIIQPGSNQLLIDGSRVLMPSAQMKGRSHNVLFVNHELDELSVGNRRAVFRGRGVLRHDHLLPGEYRIPDDISSGDTAVVLDVGAYCATQHMEFLNIPAAAEVMVTSSGEISLMTRRGHELDKWRNLVDAEAPVFLRSNSSVAKGSVAPLRQAVDVSVPARSAISVFDMNTFARGKPGGGNLGIALPIHTKLAVRRRTNAAPKPASNPEHQRLFEHCTAMWSAHVGDTGPFELEVLETPMQHIGLASSSAFQTATYAALNWLDGSPLSDAQLLDLLYTSYKEVVDGQIVDGFTTGLSGFLNLYGGFVALETDLRPLRSVRLPAWNYLVAVPRGWASSAFGDEEVKLLMGEGTRLDARDRDEKRRLLDEVLLPAIEKHDLRAFGQGVARVQQLGNKRCEILLHGERMTAALEQLTASGAECVYLSAIGPAIVVLSEGALDHLAPLLDKLELDAAYSGQVDSTGIVLTSSDAT